MTPTPDRADLAAYLDMIFGYVEAEGSCIALRGTGEKGTAGEGAFVNPIIVPGITTSFDVDRIFGHVQRWSQHGHASFIVPAAVAALALEDKHATEDRILALTTILVDIDKGDTAAKLAHAAKHLGQPTMTVHSGGTTETGHPKLHAYWRLSEASDQVAVIAAARKTLALKLGGDPSFGRSTQVIRLPGSIYGKGGVAKPCKIADITKYEYDLADLLAMIEDMPIAEGVTVSDGKLAPMLNTTAFSTGAGLSFSGFQAAHGDRDNKADLKVALTTTIAEGGDEDRNRWGEFNKVAGLHIHQARAGLLTLDEGEAHTATWAATHMDPPWPPVRLKAEWKALVARDVRDKGAMPAQPSSAVGHVDQPAGTSTNTLAGPKKPLTSWRVDEWVCGPPPKRKFLVPGLIMAAKHHLFAAEGGAGKTFLLLDLALKVAAHEENDGLEWCGVPLTSDAQGAVVMFTTEDDMEELHIRLTDIDKDALRHRAAEKLMIVPTINSGGSFPLVERERVTGSAVISRQWAEKLDELRQIPDLKLVIIDTLNSTMHGEENSATVINEYVRAASVVCGEMGAALIVTHHVRKPNANAPVHTAADMAAAVRGSGALNAAFRVVLGAWHASDYKTRMARMGMEPESGRLYNLDILKANNPEMIKAPRVLLRSPKGLLIDYTDRARVATATKLAQEEAWMLKAVEEAAKAGFPFSATGASTGFFARRGSLPLVLGGMTRGELQHRAEMLIKNNLVVKCNPKGSKTLNHLDVQGGPLAANLDASGMGAYRVAEGAWLPPSWDHEYAYDAILERVVRKEDVGRFTFSPPVARPATAAEQESGFEGSEVTDQMSNPDADNSSNNGAEKDHSGNGPGMVGKGPQNGGLGTVGNPNLVTR